MKQNCKFTDDSVCPLVLQMFISTDLSEFYLFVFGPLSIRL